MNSTSASMSNPDFRNAAWDAYDALKGNWKNVLRDAGWERIVFSTPDFILDRDVKREVWKKDGEYLEADEALQLAQQMHPVPDFKVWIKDFESQWIAQSRS